MTDMGERAAHSTVGALPAAGVARRRRRSRLRPLEVVAYVWLALIIGGAIFAAWLPLPDPTRAAGPPRSPAFEHGGGLVLGTDRLGRSLLARVVFGARVSLVAGVCAATAAIAMGLVLGVVAGYRRRFADATIGVVTETMLAVPALVLLIALTATLGRGLFTIVLGLALIATPPFIRLARANALRASSESYVLAAQTIGTKEPTIMAREILPNVIGPVTAYAVVITAVLIVAESSLSYLGLGIRPPTPSWGTMIAEGQSELQTYPHIVLVPAVTLFLTVFAMNVLGERLQRSYDALPPAP